MNNVHGLDSISADLETELYVTVLQVERLNCPINGTLRAVFSRVTVLTHICK